MVKHITPSLIGLPLDKVRRAADGGEFYGPAPGTVVKGNDARDYILATASGAIASGAASVLTEAGFTMAFGAGQWTAPTVTGGLVAGDIAWFRKSALDAT